MGEIRSGNFWSYQKLLFRLIKYEPFFLIPSSARVMLLNPRCDVLSMCIRSSPTSSRSCFNSTVLNCTRWPTPLAWWYSLVVAFHFVGEIFVLWGEIAFEIHGKCYCDWINSTTFILRHEVLNLILCWFLSGIFEIVDSLALLLQR